MTAQQDNFFLRKAIAKGLLWLSLRATGDQRKEFLKSAELVLNEAEPFSPYTSALWNRLKGRAAFVGGETIVAAEYQTKAHSGFESLSIGISERLNSLQSICCLLETAIYQAATCPESLYEACDAVQRFSDNLGGLMGSANERIDGYLGTIREFKASQYDSVQASYALVALLEG